MSAANNYKKLKQLFTTTPESVYAGRRLKDAEISAQKTKLLLARKGQEEKLEEILESKQLPAKEEKPKRSSRKKKTKDEDKYEIVEVE